MIQMTFLVILSFGSYLSSPKLLITVSVKADIGLNTSFNYVPTGQREISRPRSDGMTKVRRFILRLGYVKIWSDESFPETHRHAKADEFEHFFRPKTSTDTGQTIPGIHV